MDEDKPHLTYRNELRARAEDRISTWDNQHIDKMSADDIPNLIHELETHQIELEMQNQELRRTHDVLTEMRDQYTELYDYAPVGYLTMSSKGLIQQSNLTFAEMLGVPRAGLANQPLSNFIVNDDQDIYYMHQNSLCETQRIHGCDLRLHNYQGDSLWVRLASIYTVNPTSGSVLVRATLSDINERKLAENALVKLQAHHANIIDSMPSVIIGVDAECRVTQWNTQADRATGKAVNDVLGQPLAHIFPRLSNLLSRVHYAMQTHREWSDTKRPYLQDGKTRYEDVTIYPLVADSENGAVIRIDDVTEQVQLEEAMMQSDKMLSVGELAVGMAHEINNPLAGMIQNANVIQTRLTKEELPANLHAAQRAGIEMQAIRAYMEERKILPMLNSIASSGCRAADIVNNMLSFARKSGINPVPHDMADLLDKTLALAAIDFNLETQRDFKTIKIVRAFEQDLPLVPCEGSKIQQVFLDILLNGAQAMREAGIAKPQFTLRTRYKPEQAQVSIEIEDNGPGMDKAIRKRIFEPFFTTKGVGVGTGLGLSICYFIITDNHGGDISVHSELGQGTKFIIDLPLEKPK